MEHRKGNRTEIVVYCVFHTDVSLLSYAVQRVKDNLSYTFNENVNAVAKYQQQEETSADRYKQFQDNERKFVTKPSQTFNLFGSSSNDKTECK